jgi:hypothetical protein
MAHRTLRRSMFAAYCAAALSCTPAVAGQSAEDPLLRYNALVNAYSHGDPGTIEAILGWNDKQIADVLSRLDKPAETFHPSSLEWYKAAGMLHTDAALRLLDEDETAAGNQLETGLMLLRTGIDHHVPGLEPFASRWCLAVSRVLRDRMRPQPAERFLAKSRERLPADPVVLFESGTPAEELATHYAFQTDLGMTDAMKRRSIEGIVERLIQRRKEHLGEAAHWLGLAIDAQSTEMARLHLARVRMLLGDDAEAARLLAGVEPSSDPLVAYIAALFAAAVHEREGRLEDAAAASAARWRGIRARTRRRSG